MAAGIPNGSATAPIEVPSSQPTVVGINFGNAYASIAVLNKEGQAECIANEDGERQIACAISFNGEELHLGNHAKQQLVKNADNTITGFRNLLGKKFSELPKDAPSTSAAVVQHPEQPDVPAYRVQVLQPAPSPLPPSSKINTPAASIAPTPRNEPTPVERILTPSEVTSIFLKSLLKSAEDFLGRKADGVVISVPHWFEETQREALKAAAADAEIKVLQLLEDAGAAAVTASTNPGSENLPADRTALVVDLGASSLSLTLIQISDGLFVPLAETSETGTGGDAIDDRVIKHFAKEFTKKTKAPLAVVPSKEKGDVRAEAKLRLALEHTKRTVSASAGAATCSVESLKDGLDFTGAINRMRFDMEARPIYSKAFDSATKLLESAGRDWLNVDEIIYVGGSASLPGLDDALAAGYSDDTFTPFKAGTVQGGGAGDPTTVIARGCALQAALLASLGDDVVKAAFANSSAKTLEKTLALVFPGSEEVVPVLPRGSALPARRRVAVEAQVSGGRLGVELWEAKEGIKVDLITPPKPELDEGEEEDDYEEDPEEVKEKTIEKETLLSAVEVKTSKTGKPRLEIYVEVGEDGKPTFRAGVAGEQ
ncbi:unnamed protein product [Peniophora sp. CBMAI 1063]|nr:unnamed protein product [Peniophora sp. CBMAI 1063]